MSTRQYGRAKYQNTHYRKVADGKTPRTAYLHGDGTVIFIFEKTVNGSRVEWAEVHQNYVNSVHVSSFDDEGRSIAQDASKGRIIFRDYGGISFLALAKGGDLDVSIPHLKNGSNKTQERSIRLGSIHAYSRDGQMYVDHELPDLLSGNYATQYGKNDFDEDMSKYGTSWESLRGKDKIFFDTPVTKWVENPKPEVN